MTNEIERKIQEIKDRLKLQEDTTAPEEPTTEIIPNVTVVDHIEPSVPHPEPPPSPTPYPVAEKLTEEDKAFYKEFVVTPAKDVATLMYDSVNRLGDQYPYFQSAKVIIKNEEEETILTHSSYTAGRIAFRLPPSDVLHIELVEYWTDLGKNAKQSYGTFVYRP